MPPAEDFQLPGYQSIKSLGQGGTAAIYLVRRQSDNRLLAAKTCLPEIPELAEKFAHLIAREYSLVAKYRFPGLVRLHKIISDSHHRPVLTMEYCPGQTLEELTFPLKPELMADILSAIALDLYFLKIVGLYHGDLKPGNIFLPQGFGTGLTGPRFHLKLFDFSLALKETEKSDQRLGLGTVGYMAPETIDNGHLDHGSDIFSLGVIAYKIATGRNPFSDEEHDPMRISARVKEYDPPPPSRINGALNTDWDNFILAMLAKDASRRPSDGFEICQRLEKLGAAYPYHRLIRPKYILEHYAGAKPLAILESRPFQIEDGFKGRIMDLAGEESDRLRLVLESHFNRELLNWHEGKLLYSESAKKLPRPRFLAKRDRAAFRNLDWQNKKLAVKSAVVGETGDCRLLELAKGEYRGIERPLLAFIRNRLSPTSLRRLALSLARTAPKTPETGQIRARLFLQAENLEEGFAVIMDAVQLLINSDQPEPACRYLERLDSLCEKQYDWTHRRLVLMKWGDTMKKIGEASRGEEIYRRLIALYAGRPVDALLAETYKDLGDIYKMKQDAEAGKEMLKKAMEIYSSLGNRLELSHVMNNLGNLLSLDGDHHAAFRYYREAFKIQRQLDSQSDMASTLNNMSRYYIFQGRHDRVKNLQKLALGLNRQIGNALEIARSLNNLGYIYYELGDFENAIACLKESLVINGRSGIKGEIIINLENLSAAYQGAGFLQEAMKTAQEGIELAVELDYKPALASLLNIIAIIHKRQGCLGSAWKKFGQIEKIMHDIDDPELALAVGINKADLLYKFNRAPEAGAILEALLRAGEKNTNRKTLATAMAMLARINEDQALLDKARSIFEEIKSHRDQILIGLKRLGMALSRKDEKQADSFVDVVLRFIRTPHPDLEKAKAAVLLGQYYAFKGNLAEAVGYFEKGVELAQKGGLRPEWCEASYGLAKAHAQDKDYERAYAMFRTALEVLKEQARDISDEANRNTFLNRKIYRELAGYARNLKSILTKKSGAGR